MTKSPSLTERSWEVCHVNCCSRILKGFISDCRWTQINFKFKITLKAQGSSCQGNRYFSKEYLCGFRDKLDAFSQQYTLALLLSEAGMSDCLLFIQKHCKCPVASALLLTNAQTDIWIVLTVPETWGSSNCVPKMGKCTSDFPFL